MAEVVMMLTEKGMRILFEELRKGSKPEHVFDALADAEREPSQDEVDELVKGYEEYKSAKNKEIVDHDRTKRLVVDYLIQEGKPVQLADIRYYLQSKGVYWNTKISTANMQRIMKTEPNVVNVGFGKYAYEVQGGTDDDQTREI